MKKSNILFFALLWSLSISAQIQWQKSLGGTNFDNGRSIIQTSDSGYVVAGYSESNDGDVTGNHGDDDCWVVKLNASGIIQWQQSLGGTIEDKVLSIIQTSDNGYAMAGHTSSNDGDVTGFHGVYDCWVVKLNASGTIQWQKALGGTASDIAYSIIQTSDSGYVIAGVTGSNDGDVTGNHGGFDSWVVKLNSSGTIEWQKTLGGTNADWSQSIVQTSDSGYIFAGYSQSNNGDVTGNQGGYDYWVVKLNAAGTVEWQKTLGGTGDDKARCIIQNSDSGYTVAGYSLSNDGDVTGNHGGNDYWVVKLDTSGAILWQQSLGGTNEEEAYSVIQTSNSEYVVAGFSASNDGDVTGNHGNRDYWAVKLGTPTGIENLFTSDALHVYPNPSTDNFSIPANSEFDNAQLNIFNAMGCNVYSCRLTRQTKVIDAENFSSGIYYLQIIKGAKVLGEKIIKQ